MNSKNELSRITIDIPKQQHKRLKAKAAILGKSMREIVIEALESFEECLQSKHVPNKKTAKSIKNVEEAKNLTEYENFDDLLKKIGL